ncbi:MAG: hybrid sensor histidine kinase/response regulator [Pseudomonadota bacterium]
MINRTRQREAELKACHAEIERLEKANACKTNFIATLGHELRNPLAAISGGIQIMKVSPEKKDWALDLMQHNVWAIMSQLDDLMDITRIEQDKMKLNTEVISLQDQIRKTVESITGYIEPKQQVFNVTLPPEDIYINADPARFNQVISNLVTNASKYTPIQGTVSLTLNQQDGQAIIEVEDNGIGIPENMRDAVFEPFRQVDNAGHASGGVGIGLALVKKITSLLGGQVFVGDGTNGIGTRFTVTFPVSAELEQMKPQSENQPCILPAGFRVLVIDDNRDSVSMLHSMLEKAGATVETATDATMGLTRARAFAPHCMIVDIGLPDMDGHDLVGLLKEECDTDTLCIALTGYGYKGASEKAKQAGFDHYMIKPACFDHLLSLMTAMPGDQMKRAATG